MPHATSVCETMEEFVAIHSGQLKASGIPERFWQTLFDKLKNEIFDAGENFMIQQIVECDDDDDDYADEEDQAPEQISNGTGQAIGGDQKLVQSREKIDDDGEEGNFSWQVVVIGEEEVKFSDPKQVYLIDHAWTYRVEQARQQLTNIPGLLPRMAALMDVNEEGKDSNELLEEVLNEMWRFNQTYNIGNADLGSEAAQPIWYVMDEFGSRIQHADDPSFRVVPFCYVPTQTSFSVMWPVRNLACGDEVTRNYVEGGVTDSLTRKIRMLPWQPEDMCHLSFEQHEADESFFNKYKVHESLPNLDVTFPGLRRDCNVRVFTDINQVAEGLTDPRFEIVETEDEADILWTQKTISDFKGFSENSPNKLCNQFPFEMVLTVKDLLAMVSRRAAVGPIVDPETLNTQPKWLPTTYNLKTELPQFVSYYQHREAKGLDNHWICKPWNLARSLDSHVTGNLNYILRLPDTGPKISSKYVDSPVLYEREDVGPVKFDLRFIVMVTSVQPLHLFVHKKFLLRFANKPFSLDDFDDYEKHFTVMNYKEGVKMNEMLCEDFIAAFDEQYPGHSWQSVEASIHDVILEVFKAALIAPAPKGLGHSPQSRAMYGVDVILKWDTDGDGKQYIQPQLLEFNFGPDNTRLLGYYPDFLNDVFSVLFMEDLEGREVIPLA